MLYSKSTGGFYDLAISTVIPEDAVEISNELYRALLDGQADGKVIAAGDDGFPYLQNPPPAPVVIASVSPRQIRQALTRVNLRTAVEQAIAAGDQDMKDWWEFSTSFERQHPLVAQMGAALEQSSEQLDALWGLAGSL